MAIIDFPEDENNENLFEFLILIDQNTLFDFHIGDGVLTACIEDLWGDDDTKYLYLRLVHPDNLSETGVYEEVPIKTITKVVYR